MINKTVTVFFSILAATVSEIIRPTIEITPLSKGFVLNIDPVSEGSGTIGVYVVSLAKDGAVQTNSYKYPTRPTKYNVSGLQDGRWYALCFELDVTGPGGKKTTDGWCKAESTLKSGGHWVDVPVATPEIGIYKGVVNVKFQYEPVPLKITVKVDAEEKVYETEGNSGPKVISFEGLPDLDKVKRFCWSWAFVSFKTPFSQDYGIGSLEAPEQCSEVKIEEKYLSDRWYEQIPYGGLILAIVLSVPMAIAL